MRAFSSGLVLVIAIALASCSGTPSQRVINAAISGDPERIARTVIEEELQRQGIPTDLEGVPELIDALTRLLQKVWGERDPEIASEHRYVKYTGNFEARAIVDFDDGFLQVETVATEDPLGKLRQAVISTLLTTRDMGIEDIFTDAEPAAGGEPFLLGQVLDADGKPIRWQWRAERFASYLLENALVSRRENGRVVRSVRTALVDDHLHLRELEYSQYVLAAAGRYGVSPSLIYAVIETESAFNPYAISPAKAYGLMQVVPSTAGRDVFERIKKRSGEPSKQQLFRPDFNVDIGSAYLHLLDDVYLNRINDSTSRQYAAIASYNGGAGSTLRAFDRNRDRAVSRINRMSSAQVYAHIVADHPFAETRRYLEKVHAAEQRYRSR
jgi:membrane-bound lytic murein transglycosylase C